MIGSELPLLEQGAVHFVLFGIMLLAMLALLWITIAR